MVAAAPAMGRTARSRWVGMVWEVAEVVQAAARSERVPGGVIFFGVEPEVRKKVNGRGHVN